MVSGIVLTQQQKPGKTEPMFRRLLGRLWFNLAVDMVSDFQLNIRRTKRMKMCFGNWRAKGRSKTGIMISSTPFTWKQGLQERGGKRPGEGLPPLARTMWSK